MLHEFEYEYISKNSCSGSVQQETTHINYKGAKMLLLTCAAI